MRKLIIHLAKPALPVFMVLFTLCSGIANAQQYVINDKDNTHPEQTIKYTALPVTFTSFTVIKNNNYNEIKWNTVQEPDVRKFIIEYSANGVDYLTAGEVLPGSAYAFKHYINDSRPLLYRLRTEQLDGRYFYSTVIPLDGIEVSPVKIYPTIISGNQININAGWPVERIMLTSQTGASVFAKEIGGQRDYISLGIPVLSKGMYWITCYGDGWKATTKILIP